MLKNGIDFKSTSIIPGKFAAFLSAREVHIRNDELR